MNIWKSLSATVSLGALFLSLTPLAGCRNSLNAQPQTWPSLLASPSSFSDQGPIDQTTVLRGILAFDIQNRDALVSATIAMYSQNDPSFRKYLSTAEFDAKYGPSQADVQQTISWLEMNGLTVERTSTRSLLIEFSGTAELINTAFGFVIHNFHRTAAMPTDTSDDTYAALPEPAPPKGLPSSLAGLVGLTVPFPLSPGPEHVPTLQSALPAMPLDALSPTDVGQLYGFTSFAGQGSGNNGKGATIGVVTGFAYHDADASGFWDAWKIDRDPATDRSAINGDPITTYGDEATTDVQWAAALAPGADVIVYEMPDANELSTLWGLHEAIGRDEVDIVNDSFARAETFLAPGLVQSFDDAGLMGAALGITVVAASGDSGAVDVPAASPWITSVGGTIVARNSAGVASSEHGWVNSGCGSSHSFDRPSWQPAVLTPNDPDREVCDVSMAAAPFTWVVNKGVWEAYGGTSVSAPLMAGAIAVADGVRAAAGKPRLGWLNKRLYESTDIQSAFNDQTVSDSTSHPGATGWDCTTGWGTANVAKIAAADW